MRTGRDERLGGIVAFTKPGGGAPLGPEAPVPGGERWNDRIWWVHSEALCALAMAGAVSGDAWYVDAFEKLHRYVNDRFIDHEHSEWFMYLDCHGEVLAPQKGAWVKCFFHLPRNVMKLVCLMRGLKRQMESFS